REVRRHSEPSVARFEPLAAASKMVASRSVWLSTCESCRHDLLSPDETSAPAQDLLRRALPPPPARRARGGRPGACLASLRQHERRPPPDVHVLRPGRRPPRPASELPSP